MPLETDVNSCPKEIFVDFRITENNHRKYPSLPPQEYHTSFKQPRAINEYFRAISVLVGQITPNDPEPMMNLFAWYENNEWWVVIFPRRQHRPWQFFAEGDENILFSPGCVDFAGLIISPREKDFNRLDAPLLEELFPS